MFKDRYKKMINKVKAPEYLQEDMLDILYTDKNSKRKKLNIKRPAAALVSLCMCFAVMLPVSAYSQDILQLMNFVSPEIAQMFMPVQMSCEDNGIRMEVLSVYENEDEIQVCITMQDMTGNRVDETIDLYDSYHIHTPFSSTGHCRFSEYDEETGKAAFIVSLTGWGTKMNISDKVTFSVKCFLSGKKHYENVDIAYDMNSIKTATEVFETDITGVGGIGWEENHKEKNTVLVPQQPLADFAVDGVDITGIGYIDGKLHVQTAVKNRLKNDNHGYLWLTDYRGNRTMYDYSLYFTAEANGVKTTYEEFVFDIPLNNINMYRLQGEFWTSSMITEGNWSVRFEI